MKPKKKKPATYWYKTFVGECPVCGRNQGYRLRVYGPRPAAMKDRYVVLSNQQTYDGCVR